ncbi:NAD(P)H-dependent glycerol-3-phosphate dehydrogenase [Hippea alviniae]|uniref:NAD(P)H-dependent glycerol-3-phosphate dehydrogenase n=1 Tax=Hippea alviniae TaxID=1279027 RepID=UPI0003B34D25|nr:NAD(P)H-dependent glycerol-3-phosphate dehydrogenase [Hippea alviniae]
MLRVGVVGAGSWGSAISILLAKNGHNVSLYVREEEIRESIKRKRVNPVYLPNVEFPKNIEALGDINETVRDKDFIVFVVPVKYLRATVEQIKEKILSPVISLSKGMENETFCRPSQIIENTLKIEKIAALSGPNFALEVAKGLPTATVVASKKKETAEFFQKAFSCETFRVYTSNDIVGVEICGALKNIMAIAAGISDGLKLGHNARASLITRGLAEIMRFGKVFDAKRETFMGLAGIGDLMLTATGNLSRNRRVGLELAENKSKEEILNSMKMVPEGINTTKSVYEFAQRNDIEMPITSEIYKILFENKNPKEALRDLMNRPLKEENYLL